MSCFLNLNSANRGFEQFTAYSRPTIEPVDFRLDITLDEFGGVLWPGSRMTGADYVNVAPIWQSQRFEIPIVPGGFGVHGRKHFSGLTKDSNGNPLSGATVKIYDSTTDEMLDTATSDSSGNYRLAFPRSSNTYIVAYLAGSPDVSGTTSNTLTGT